MVRCRQNKKSSLAKVLTIINRYMFGDCVPIQTGSERNIRYTYIALFDDIKIPTRCSKIKFKCSALNTEKQTNG